MESIIEGIVEVQDELFSAEDIQKLDDLEREANRETLEECSSAHLMSPYDNYRGWLYGYITVSNLVSQLWCEQQLEYSFTAPKPPPTEAVKQGTEMHLARELELYEVIDIQLETREDEWAITFLNCYPKLKQLCAGHKAREIPVFGDPYGSGIFTYGIIDELCYTSDGKLQLVELKSRNASKSLPSKAQQKKTALQVMLYKTLFDNLVKGKVPINSFTRAFNVNWEAELSVEPLDYAKNLGLTCRTLHDVLEILLLQFQYSGIQTISSMVVEYCFQGDFTTITKQQVAYDQEKLDIQMLKFLEYWKGNRSAKGVDVEEAWKCYSCDFVEDCSWRKMKDEECRQQNKLKYEN